MPLPIRDYREAFIGGGSVLTAVVNAQGSVPRRLWVNDKDPSTYSPYAAAAWYPELFKEAVQDFPTENFDDEYKRIGAKLLAGIPTPTTPLTIVETAVDKMFIQYNSFQSLGQQAGPRRKPNPRTGTHIKWNTQMICDKIDWYWRLLRDANITCGDFAPLFDGEGGVVFADPPWRHVGADGQSDEQKQQNAKRAYQYSFEECDHVRLYDCCRQTGHHVVLSYDNSAFIRDLHKRAILNPIETYYHASRRRATKLAIVWPGGSARDAAAAPPLRIAALKLLPRS